MGPAPSTITCGASPRLFSPSRSVRSAPPPAGSAWTMGRLGLATRERWPGAAWCSTNRSKVAPRCPRAARSLRVASTGCPTGGRIEFKVGVHAGTARPPARSRPAAAGSPWSRRAGTPARCPPRLLAQPGGPAGTTTDRPSPNAPGGRPAHRRRDERPAAGPGSTATPSSTPSSTNMTDTAAPGAAGRADLQVPPRDSRAGTDSSARHRRRDWVLPVTTARRGGPDTPTLCTKPPRDAAPPSKTPTR